MSATNRGTVRAAFDNYPTPPWCVRRLLERWRPDIGCASRYRKLAPRVLEPCAGEGAIVRVVREMWPAANITACDLRVTGDTAYAAGADYTIEGIDMLTASAWPEADIVITNPPFRHADAFIERALSAASHVAMLLPFQRLGDGHREFFTRVGLPYLYMLPERPAFVATTRCKSDDCLWCMHVPPHDPIRVKVCPVCGAGTSRCSADVNCYAWFTWGPAEGRASAQGGYEYLPPTPLAERKAAA